MPETEVQATPSPEPQAATPEPQAAPSPEPAAAPAPAPSPEPASPPWFLREISNLRGQVRELKAQVAAPAKPAPVVANGVVTLTEAELQAQIQNGARALSAQERFNEECNDLAARGAQAHPDFMTRVSALQSVDSGEKYGTMLSAVLAMGEQGPGVIHRLGGDLEAAARIMALPPVQMGMELHKLASTPASAPVLPNPVTGVVGARGATHLEIAPSDPRGDQLPTDEWMKRRNAEVAANNKRGLRMQ